MFCGSVNGQDTWTEKANFSGGVRNDAASFSIYWTQIEVNKYE